MDLKPQQQSLEKLKQFRDWWLGELRQSVPAGVGRLFDRETATLTIRVEVSVARFELRTREGEHLLGVVNLLAGDGDTLNSFRRDVLSELPADLVTQVYLSGDQLLVSDQYLPLATEANLGGVLGFEIDRLTPFPKDQVVFGYRRGQRYPEKEKVLVGLFALPRRNLDFLLARLELLGLSPQGIYPENFRGEETLNLLPESLRPAQEALWNVRAKRLGVMALALLGALILYPLFQLNNQIDSLEQKVEELREAATVVGSKQSLLAARLAAQDTLVARKNQMPLKLAIVQEVTHLLPDNTWVSRLRVDDQTVDLQGESSKASDLIELLEQSGQFQNVQFISPVTVNPSTNMERYEIKMQLAEVVQ